jgi:hypothetical protein
MCVNTNFLNETNQENNSQAMQDFSPKVFAAIEFIYGYILYDTNEVY